VQPNGKIVVAGTAGITGDEGYDEHFALVRYNADGSVDPGFGVDGKVIPVFRDTAAYLKDAVLQRDGRIVVAGELWSPNPPAFAIARYNADGSADASFALNGIFSSQSAPNLLPCRVGLQRDGK